LIINDVCYKGIQIIEKNEIPILIVRSKNMIDNKVKIEVPADILANWQDIANILAEIVRIL